MCTREVCDVRIDGQLVSASAVQKFLEYLTADARVNAGWAFSLQADTAGFRQGLSTSNAAEVQHASMTQVRQLPLATAILQLISAQKYRHFFKIRDGVINSEAGPFELANGKYHRMLAEAINSLPSYNFHATVCSSSSNRFIVQLTSFADASNSAFPQEKVFVDLTAIAKQAQTVEQCTVCMNSMPDRSLHAATCDCVNCEHLECDFSEQPCTDHCACDDCTSREFRCGECIIRPRPCGSCNLQRSRCMACSAGSLPCDQCAERRARCKRCVRRRPAFTNREYLQMAGSVCSACQVMRIWGLPCVHVLASYRAVRSELPQGLLVHPSLHAGRLAAGVASAVSVNPAAIDPSSLAPDNIMAPFSLLTCRNKKCRQ